MPKKEPAPTQQYRVATAAIRDGNWDIAESAFHKMTQSSRSAREAVEIAHGLGADRTARLMGFNKQEQLVLTSGGNGHEMTLLGFALDRLARTGANGLRLYDLVTDFARETGVPEREYTDLKYRRAQGSILRDYIRVGELVMDPAEANEKNPQVWNPAYAPKFG